MAEVSFLPVGSVPPLTQRMWEIACADLERAEVLLAALEKDETATQDVIARRRYEARARKAMCKAINFMITNAADINAVIARKQSGQTTA